MIDERFIYNENGVPRPNPALPPEPPEDGPAQFGDEPFARRVVSYLLGELSEEESEKFEDECFAQKEWPSQINLVEEDLIDAYLHDELEAEQRTLFERNYLTTEARKERVWVAAALNRRACESNGVARQPVGVARDGRTWAERLQALWGGRGWGLRATAAAVALVIMTGGAWLYLSRPRPPRAVAALRLTVSVNNRSAGAQARTVKLPPDADALRVFLTLPDRAPPAPRYRVELDDEGGSSTPLDAEGQDAQAVAVLIPASRLAPGRYALKLFAVGPEGTERRIPGSYFFNVE